MWDEVETWSAGGIRDMSRLSVYPYILLESCTEFYIRRRIQVKKPEYILVLNKNQNIIIWPNTTHIVLVGREGMKILRFPSLLYQFLSFSPPNSLSFSNFLFGDKHQIIIWILVRCLDTSSQAKLTLGAIRLLSSLVPEDAWEKLLHLWYQI